MKTPQPKSTSRRAPRPVRVPPPLTRGSEKFEGSSVLTEFEGDLGILLWQSLRNVLLWNATEPAKRKDLFSPGAEERRRVKLLSVEVEDTLRSPLAVLARLLADPAGADKKRVSAACQKIGEWAEARGSTATALAYIQAAALVASDARLSYEVGRLARQRAEYPRAETWYRRAILLGRRSGDWESYSRAFIGLGNLYILRGNLPAAQRALLRAYRASRRKGLRDVQGRALHDLFGVAARRNQAHEAEEFAASALKAYGSAHPKLPSLAHDVALFWMGQGCYAPALTVFQALLPHFQRAVDRGLVLAHIARASAGVHDRPAFEEAWQRGLALVEEEEASDKYAVALLDLAYGAADMEEWDRAEQVAQRALEVATAREEKKTRAMAEELLSAVREGREGKVVKEVEAEPWMVDHADALSQNFARSLSAGGAAR